MSTPQQITCPICRMVSYNPDDIEHRYCGHCNQFHNGMPKPHPDWVRKTADEVEARFVEETNRANRLSFGRDPGLVRAELVDALRDYAGLFREKMQMELRRAESVEAMASTIAAGGACTQPDVEASGDFGRAYHLLELRFNELRLKCSRLMMEHGNN